MEKIWSTESYTKDLETMPFVFFLWSLNQLPGYAVYMQMTPFPPLLPPFAALEVGCSETALLSFTSLIRAAPAQKTSADTSHTSSFPPQIEEPGFRNKKNIPTQWVKNPKDIFVLCVFFFPPLSIASTVLFSYQGIL